MQEYSLSTVFVRRLFLYHPERFKLLLNVFKIKKLQKYLPEVFFYGQGVLYKTNRNTISIECVLYLEVQYYHIMVVLLLISPAQIALCETSQVQFPIDLFGDLGKVRGHNQWSPRDLRSSSLLYSRIFISLQDESIYSQLQSLHFLMNALISQECIIVYSMH